MWLRHGSLFQQNTKAKPVVDDRSLFTLVTYIHQNPLRSNLVDKAEDWCFSSFRDYIDERKGTLQKKQIIYNMIDKDDLKELTSGKLIWHSSDDLKSSDESKQYKAEFISGFQCNLKFF